MASRRASELYGLEVLEECIQDNPDNVTRFLVLAREPLVIVNPLPGTYKTTIVFSLIERRARRLPLGAAVGVGCAWGRALDSQGTHLRFCMLNLQQVWGGSGIRLNPEAYDGRHGSMVL